MINKQLLSDCLAGHGLAISDEDTDLLDRYARFLVEYNKNVNLTAITDPDGITVRHFADSLLLLKSLGLSPGTRILDVGAGAGFPSVPLLVVRRDLDVTLLDGREKKVRFLRELLANLGLDAAAIHGRAEELGRSGEHRERYDIVTARAVARLRELAEYCLPFVKVGGIFAAMKSVRMEEELPEAEAAIAECGGEVERIDRFCLAGEAEDAKRNVILIKKISQTSTKYPRSSTQIAKRPIK